MIRARRQLAVLTCCVSVIGLAGCRVQRSADAFCDTYWEQTQAFQDRYEQAADDVRTAGEEDALVGVLGGLSMMAQSLGDTVVIFDRLDKVAPSDIEPDVAAVRDSLKAQMGMAGGAATDPLGSLVQGLFMGLAAGGSWQRVNDYVVANCGTSAESVG